MKPCWRPCAASTSPIAEIPSVTSQNPQFPTRKLQSGASFISKRASAGGTPAPRRPAARTTASRGQTYIVPAIAHTTNVPKTVRCECAMTKSVKCVGWLERAERLQRALEAADQVHERAHDQELRRQVPRELLPAADHGAEEVLQHLPHRDDQHHRRDNGDGIRPVGDRQEEIVVSPEEGQEERDSPE